MTEPDEKIMKLLEEIRTTQQQQVERESNWMQRFAEMNQEHLKKERETYAASQQAYQESLKKRWETYDSSQRSYKDVQDTYKKSLRRYIRLMPVGVVVTVVLFGIIALSHLAVVILKIIGK